VTATWFVRGGGKVYGPLDSARLKQLVIDGKIDESTEVAQAAAGPWYPAGSVKGLFPQSAIGQNISHSPPPSPVAATSAAVPKRGWYRRWWAIFLVYPFLAFVGCGVVIQLTVPKETLAKWRVEADERNRKRADKQAADRVNIAKTPAARARGEEAGHQAGFLWAKVGKRKPERVVLEAAAALEAEKAIPSNKALVGSGSDEERLAYARGYAAAFSVGYDKAN
jgi:hypothetical protein